MADQPQSVPADRSAMPDPYQTSATLLQRLKTVGRLPGDQAWAEFHARYAPVISAFARRLGAKPSDIDDLVQDVLMGFVRANDEFVYDRRKGRFRGYLKVCTIGALNRRRRENRKFLSIPEELDPKDGKLEEHWDEAWEKALLKRAIELVRKDYRDNKTFQAFELVTLRNQKPQQISATLGMSVDSVYQARSRITAAVQKLARELAEVDEQLSH
jgi:RNA polymerase sigma factor (sigma-70 family)